MKLLVVCLFVCLVSVYAAPLDQDTFRDPLRHLLDVVRKGTVDNGNNDDANDTQPAEERLTPSTGKFEGDILLTPEEEKEMKEADKNVRKRGVGYAAWGYRWPENKVYYKLNSDLSSKARKGIQEAMADWEKYTCTRFIQGPSPRGHYIDIFNGIGCYSCLGYIQEAGQKLSIGFGCEEKGTVMHELAHAQGIIHEQSRMDRDNYVTIKFENIISDKEYNFEKHADTKTDGFPYDYQSMMHYGDKIFSKNGLPTIVTKAGAPIGQRLGFSSTDIQFANAFLQCATGGIDPSLKNIWPDTKCKQYYDHFYTYCRFPEFRQVCAKSCGS